ncbi:MAG: RluA family pseudouridine synthase [Kiritimatiellaeota bacterium]|nr:RluA family pseudouridine synthase [Kiritimatiellota bacterium]
MISNLQLVVAAAEAGLRLDRWLLQRCPSTTRALALDALAGGHVLVQGQPAVKGAKLAAGDRVEVRGLLEHTDLAVQPDGTLPLDVVFEDKHLLALNKPAGMPVHPLRAGELGTLANALLARYPALAQVGGQPLFPAFVHRIDGDTSGLVLAAKNEEIYRALRRAFQARQVKKIYLALVQGVPARGLTLEHELAHDPGRPGRMVPVTDRNRKKIRRPLRAVTEFDIERRFASHALLRVIICTVVTPQIRCQRAASGHPIVGDHLYGGDAPPTPTLPDGRPRHFLHAARLELTHPALGTPLTIAAPLPPELEAVLRTLSFR